MKRFAASVFAVMLLFAGYALANSWNEETGTLVIDNFEGDSIVLADIIEGCGINIQGSDIKHLIISGVTDIGKNGFWNCSNLISVNLPDIINIEEYAFFNLQKIKSVNMPKVETIGERAFYECSDVEELDMPKVEVIGDAAFCWCDSLKTVNMPNVSALGTSAFELCSALQEVSVPKAKTIGICAFSECFSLKTADISGATHIGEFAFYDCKKLVSVDMQNVKTIGRYAFADSSLMSADIPKAKIMEEYAFGGCESLTRVSMPSVKVIGEGAFRYCKKLENVDIPNSATSIEKEAFGNCEQLKRVNIPASVTEFGKNIFENDKLLVIYGEIGSMAERYASRNKIPFFSATPILVSEKVNIFPGVAVALNPEQPGIEDPEFTYSSSNKQVVSVASDGTLEGKKSGEATITVTSSHGEKAEVKVIVTSVKITNVENSTLSLGCTLTLEPLQSGTKGAKYTYKTSDRNVVSVGKTGEVKALKAGKAKITITSSFGEKKEITITVKSVKIKLNKTSLKLSVGDTFTLKPSQPNTKGAKYTYKTSNKKVAAVDKKGVIKGVKKGTATITVTSSFGETAKVKVTVK